MGGKMPKKQNDKNKLHQLDNELNWIKSRLKVKENKKSKSSLKQDEIKIIYDTYQTVRNDILTYLNSLRNYYVHFWQEKDQKEINMPNKMTELEAKDYQFENIGIKNFKEFMKLNLFSFKLKDKLSIEKFRIAFLSIFISKYDSAILLLELPKPTSKNTDDYNEIKYILSCKNKKRILLHKDVDKDEYILPETNPINDILNKTEIINGTIDLSKNKQHLYNQIIRYFKSIIMNDKKSKFKFNWYNNIEFYQLNDQDVKSIKNPKYKISLIKFKNGKNNIIIFKKNLINFLILFYIENTEHNSKKLANFLNKFTPNELEIRSKSYILKNKPNVDKQTSYNTKTKEAFLKMLEGYKNSGNKDLLIKHGLKWFNKNVLMSDWIPKDKYGDDLKLLWSESMTTMENVKKYLFFNNYEKIVKLGELVNKGSYNVGYYFAKELNLNKDDDFSAKLLTYIKSNYKKETLIKNDIETIITNDQEKIIFIDNQEKEIFGKLRRYKMTKIILENLEAQILKDECLYDLKFNKIIDRKIFLSYLILIKLNNSKVKTINRQLFKKSVFNNNNKLLKSDHIKNKLQDNKKESNLYKDKNHHIINNYFFKSVLLLYTKYNYKDDKSQLTNDDLNHCLSFYKKYSDIELDLINKCKTWTDPKNTDGKENIKIILRNLIMHRDLNYNDIKKVSWTNDLQKQNPYFPNIKAVDLLNDIIIKLQREVLGYNIKE